MLLKTIKGEPIMPYVLQGLFALVGRVLLCAIFLLSAVNHTMNFNPTVDQMVTKGVPVPQVLLAGALVFLFLGSLSVILGFKARIGALLLLIFLAAVTPVFHDFWNLPEQAQQGQMIHFLKNVSMGGAILLILGNGPGLFSVDVLMARTGKQ